MTTDETPKEENNVISLDDVKIQKLHQKGHYFSLFERFELLRVKFVYDKLSVQETMDFILLIKYFMRYGHSEAVKLNCHYMYQKYIEGKGL